MKPLTLAQLVQVCDAELRGPELEAPIQNVSTDTRNLPPGSLFVALKGESHDGHNFVADACAKGALAVVVSRPVEAACPQLIVRDTLVAYGKLGALCRSESKATFLAVTGSAGKTTTKDFLGSIVQLEAPSLVTRGTENNEIGVPRLLLELEPEHRYCVLELAMRGPGEIGYLANLCKPHTGVITNIGEAHVGRLGSREAIAKTKAELLTSLPPEGHAVLNADDFFFGLLSELAPCRVASFGFGPAPEDVEFHLWADDVHLAGLEPARFTLRLGAARVPVTLQLPGRHNIANALAAAAAGLCAGLSLETVRVGLESYEGAEMRSEVLQTPGGFTVINDAYNASPTSTPEALKVLAQSAGRRIFVFGDMLELGPTSEEAHRKIGRLAVEAGVEWLVTIGKDAAFAALEAEALGIQVNALTGAEEALALLRPVLEAGDTVLVKASRGMKLEAVVRGLMDVA